MCVHLCLKNDTDVAHYYFDAHQPILVIFGRDGAERVCYQMVIFSRCGRKCKQIVFLSPLTLLFMHKFLYLCAWSSEFFLILIANKIFHVTVFYLFNSAINLWHRKFVTADVTAVFVSNQHGIQCWRQDFNKNHSAYTVTRVEELKLVQFVCIMYKTGNCGSFPLVQLDIFNKLNNCTSFVCESCCNAVDLNV